VFVTATTDFFGFLIFLGLATFSCRNDPPAQDG
jgi:Mg/Co/Ni transporter MgtE